MTQGIITSKQCKINKVEQYILIQIIGFFGVQFNIVSV
jgi:hypothetical protein